MHHPSEINKKIAVISSLLILTTPSLSSAAGVSNGDFSSNYASWSQDVDGLGSPILGLDDFTIVQPTPGNNSARIEADYWSIPGDTFSTPNNEAWFGSTLYQELDLSASAGQDLVLSFDWSFLGEAGSSDEIFFVFLSNGTGDRYGADGLIGSLLNPLDYSTGAYNTFLDSSFANATGWTLEFQMNNAGYDAYGSHAIIDNVSLTTVSQPVNNVPEPAVIWLMGMGAIGLAKVQRNKKVA